MSVKVSLNTRTALAATKVYCIYMFNKSWYVYDTQKSISYHFSEKKKKVSKKIRNTANLGLS